MKEDDKIGALGPIYRDYTVWAGRHTLWAIGSTRRTL